MTSTTSAPALFTRRAASSARSSGPERRPMSMVLYPNYTHRKQKTVPADASSRAECDEMRPEMRTWYGLSSVTAFRDDLAAPPLGVLLLGEELLAALEGIGAGAQLDAHRRALQLENLAKRVLQVALVRGFHSVQAAAVDDDDGRIGATLVRIAHLGAEAPRERRAP